MKTYPKELTVVISGCAGRGKSTVAALIYRALTDKGIKVSLSDGNEEIMDEERMNRQIQFNLDNFDVKVETKQLNREVFDNSGELIKA